MASLESVQDSRKRCHLPLCVTVPWRPCIAATESLSCSKCDERVTSTREEPGLAGAHAGRRRGGARSALQRRTFLKGAGVAAIGVGSAAVLPLFGTPSAHQDPKDCRAQDLSASQNRLVVSHCPAYIDPATKKQKNTLEDFEAATGISVDYTEDVSDNAEIFDKGRNQRPR